MAADVFECAERLESRLVNCVLSNASEHGVTLDMLDQVNCAT